MRTPIINKKTDALVQKAKDIREGKNKSFVFCEGEKNVGELLRSGWTPTAVYGRPDTAPKLGTLLKTHNKNAVPLYVLSPAVMDYLSDVDTAPGFIAISKRPSNPEGRIPTENPLVLLLHGLQLPQNLGALFRTAEAAGVDSLWLTQNTADAYHPKTIRGSSGSVFRLRIKQGLNFTEAVEALKAQKISIVAAHQQGTADYDQIDWTRPTALLMGAEGPGLKPAELSAVGTTVRIPMAGRIESLNVAAAAAVCLFEAVRQRRRKGTHA